MLCNKCGSEIKEDNKFCTNCGNKVIKDENDCYILFERMKQFYGCLVPINIYLDGNRVGSVKSNKSIKIEEPIDFFSISIHSNKQIISLKKKM